MPYGKKEELPDAVKALPEHGQEIWMAAFNSAFDQYKGDEEKCFATAWEAVKNKYEKNEKGEWVAKAEHNDGLSGWIEIFRAGKQRDSSGEEREWTEAELDEIIKNYDPRHHEAPAVIGHPKEDHPAWAWTEALKREGKILFARLRDAVPEFADMVRQGMFKKRSACFYVQPKLSLKHIGFLGAMAPAVKGLADIKFSGEGVVIEFGDEIQKEKKGGTKMGLKDLLKGIFTRAIDEIPEDQLQAAQPKTFSEAEVKERERLAAENAGKSFSEKEKALKAREDDIGAQEKETQKKSLSDFCEGLLRAGKLTPAMNKQGMGLVSFLESIAGISVEVEFEEAGAKKKQTALDFAKAFLEGLPKAIEYGEIAKRGSEVPAGGAAAEKLNQLIRAKMDKDKNLSYAVAFNEVQKENPDLTKEYQQEIGPALKK